MTEPAFQPFAAAFHCMVVPEASTSCGWFSRTVPAPSKQRTQSRPPSAPPTSQCANANSFACVVCTTKAAPRFAFSSSPRPVAATPSSPFQDSAAMVVSVVVEVAMMQAPSTPISVLLWRKAAARRFGMFASSRVSRDAGARWRL